MQPPGDHGAAVYAPEGDKLHRHASLMRLPVNPGGRLVSSSVPDADLLVAAHSLEYVSRPVRDRLTLGAIGFHPSLLPLHRGRDAIKWTVRMGDRITGGTVYWLSDTVDGGPVCKQYWCFVGGCDAGALWRESLFPMGLRLIRDALDEIAAGVLTQIDQRHDLATWEPSLDGAPRLYRPELPQIGAMVPGYVVLKE